MLQDHGKTQYALLASGSAHAKLEARITLRYVQCLSQVYRKISPLTGLGELAPLANYVEKSPIELLAPLTNELRQCCFDSLTGFVLQPVTFL